VDKRYTEKGIKDKGLQMKTAITKIRFNVDDDDWLDVTFDSEGGGNYVLIEQKDMSERLSLDAAELTEIAKICSRLCQDDNDIYGGEFLQKFIAMETKK
jgi:hypothetical protein